MKRHSLVVFNIIMLCSLLLIPIALVNAYEDGYTTTNHLATDEIVMDGAWTAGTWTYDGEWNDTEVPPNLPPTFHWRQKWTWPNGTIIMEHFLIEFFTDNTTDAGDYFQFCVDCNADGGTAPQSDDFRVDYVGHDISGLTVYRGDGSGWVEYTDYIVPDDIEIEDSISTSPFNSNPHWIIEFTMNRSKTEFDVVNAGYQPWTRVAVYDANTSTLVSWPPTSRDVPDDWGLEMGTTEPIVPEALTVVAVVLLSSVAVAVSFYLLRKKPKTENHNAVKT